MLDFFDLASKRPPFADPPMLASPKNPFTSPAALPVNSLTTEQKAMFHTICNELPTGTLPPATAKVSNVPPHADALMAAQRRRVQREIAQQ
jgi:hypothetical protein